MEHFQLRFVSISNPGRALAFPCDADGIVDIQTLPERAVANFYKAQDLQGKDYLAPVVVHSDSH
jgi:hypothetical protein